MATFTGKKIRNTYERILQITGSTIKDGLGNEVTESLNINVQNATSASYALTASYALNAEYSGDSLVSSSTQITLIDTVGNLSGSRIIGNVTLASTASIALFAISSSTTVTNEVSSSFAQTASYVEYNGIVNTPTLLSSSNQIESNISGAFDFASASIASDITNISVSFNNITNKPTLISSSAQVVISENQITDLTHYTTSDFTIDFNSKTTADLTESGSLFYTNDRVKSKLNEEDVLSGSILDLLPSGIVSSSSQINIGAAFGTASYAVLANTASYIDATDINGNVANATSASHAIIADSSLTSITATTASYIEAVNIDGTVAQATTASYALNVLNPFPYTGSAQITGSLSVAGPVTASAFIATNGLGNPTLTATSTLILSASAAVQVKGAPLRLPTFTNTQTASLTPQSGDIIYNSDRAGMMLFVGSNWYKVDVTL